MDAVARFRALFEAHHAAVRRYAFHRGIPAADADDLVAEVFAVAWRRRDDVPADDALPWLLAVAGNVRRNQARSARRYAAALRTLPPPGTAPPPGEPDDRGARLRRALAGLSDDDQEILRLVADGGPARSDWTGDPRSLLATLEPRARFELVGDETLDGVEVTHLRSRTPSVFDPGQLGLGQALQTAGRSLSRLEVWVDGDGVVRRIELASSSSYQANVGSDGREAVQSYTEVTTATVRFVDIGVPNTVEAPAEFCEVTDEMMADPPPPGTDVC
jgi:RNA polymerase sigma-70 factor (ECF subfamily)